MHGRDRKDRRVTRTDVGMYCTLAVVRSDFSICSLQRERHTVQHTHARAHTQNAHLGDVPKPYDGFVGLLDSTMRPRDVPCSAARTEENGRHISMAHQSEGIPHPKCITRFENI